MKFRRTVLSVLAVVALASSLTGCIIVPGHYGHGGGGGGGGGGYHYRH